MKFPTLTLKLFVVSILMGIPHAGFGQDSRTVTEPVIPSTCATIGASLYITSGEPSSELTFDTYTVQTALSSSACAGKAVELVASGVNNAFLIQPINIPSGVTLLVDAGVTVFASRNPADYQVSGSADTCGSTTGSGNGCKPLIIINGNATSTGSGIMGYGIINGRGGDYLIVGGVVQSYTWWSNAAIAGGKQSNPVLMYPLKANSFTLYKITLMNSPEMHVVYKDGNGFTVWGAKIITPYNAANTDGIDPTGSQNITITNSYISDGDDNVAVGSSSTSYPSKYITVSNDHIYGGHGVSIGSITNGGISDMLVDHVNFAGTSGDPYATGLRIKSAQDRGGLVQNITYQNVCIQNIRYPLQLNPFYDTNSGTEYPLFQNIQLHNVNVLSIPSNAKVELEGHDASNITTLTLDNVVFPTGSGGLTSSQLSPAPQDITITLGPGPLTPTFLQSLTGTNVSYSGSITNPTEAPYDCTNAYVYLAGELFLSDATSTNRQSLTETAPATFNLNAMLEPTVANSVAPTATINFLEGSTVVGSASLSGNGTLATVTLSGVYAGTHTYTAQYPGDSTYPALNFGSVTVTVN